jgi:hypothetical protein
MDFYNGNYSGLIEFSATTLENPFGAALLRLSEAQYDTAEDAVADIADTLSNEGFDVDQEAVLGLMTGEILPKQEVVEILLDLATNEVEEERLIQAAIDAYTVAEDRIDLDDEDVEDTDDDDEDDDDDDEDTPDSDEAEGVLTEETEAAFSRYFDEQDAIRDRLVITDELSDLRDYADELLRDRYITPKAHSLLFSRRAKDDYLNFSAVVEQSEMTADEYLKCMNFALDLFAEMGPVPGSEFNFQSVVDQDISEGPYNFSQGSDVVEEEARELLNLLNGNKSND